VLLNKKLVLVTPNGANVDSPATLEPLGGGRFRLVAPTGGGEVGEVVYFSEIAVKPMRLYVGDGYFERVK
jgi:D-alanyl-D-alanine carboxypeptidase